MECWSAAASQSLFNTPPLPLPQSTRTPIGLQFIVVSGCPPSSSQPPSSPSKGWEVGYMLGLLLVNYSNSQVPRHKFRIFWQRCPTRDRLRMKYAVIQAPYIVELGCELHQSEHKPYAREILWVFGMFWIHWCGCCRCAYESHLVQIYPFWLCQI